MYLSQATVMAACALRSMAGCRLRRVELKRSPILAMLCSRPLRVMAIRLTQPAGKPGEGQAISIEQCWPDFFSDSSHWWENRPDKVSLVSSGYSFANWWLSQKSQRSPDFRHKHTIKALHIEGQFPAWVKTEPASMVQGQAQSDDGPDTGQQTGFGKMQAVKGCEYETQPPQRLLEGLRKVVRKNFSGMRGDVGTLCQAGRLKEALHILKKQGIRADSNTYISLLQECINIKGLAEGKQVHAHATQSGFEPNIIVLNTLVSMYAKCGSMMDARQVFDNMPERDMYTLNIMIAGYAKHGCGRDALKIYEQMIGEGLTPDRITFISILKACASLAALEKGIEVHANICKAGIAPDIILETALLDMYAKCQSMERARQVFDKMARQDMISWNVMVAGYAQHGSGKEALEIYEQMIQKGVIPDRVTFISVLNACANVVALEKGKEVHADIIGAKIGPDIILENTIIDMYAKCRSMKDACLLFNNMAQRDVVSWNALIAGYAQHGCGRDALEIYDRMIGEKVAPDKVTFICILNACASLAALDKGIKVHADIVKAKMGPDINLENTLVDMYGKCGSIKDARQIFNNMPQRDVVSWNTIIAGCGQHGFGREALEIYEQMLEEGIRPNRITFICVLNVCASLAALEKGKEVHAYIAKAGITPDIILQNTLVDMYAKCGSIKDARHVFDNMVQRDVISWNSMIAGYAQHGCGREALQVFEHMDQEDCRPDNITFMCVLSTCSHVGLVDEGHHYFESMCQHGLTPMMEHYGCMVDLLGRAGQLDEAENFANKMPMKVGDAIWKALLGACRIHGDVEIAERVAKSTLWTDPSRARRSFCAAIKFLFTSWQVAR